MAMWMCDRPIPQQNLARELAGLLATSVDRRCAAVWLRAFWATMSGQWTDIDALRMEKFLLLVRRVFAAALRWCRTEEGTWEKEAVDEMVAVMGEWPFDAEDLRRVAVGLRLHVLDVWVDELEREGLLAEDTDESARQFVDRIRKLVEPLVQGSPVKSVRARAKESLEDERLPRSPDAVVVDDDNNSWDGFED